MIKTKRLFLLALVILIGCQTINNTALSTQTPWVITATPIPTPITETFITQAASTCENAFNATVESQATSAPLRALTLVMNTSNTENPSKWYRPDMDYYMSTDESKEMIIPLIEARYASEVQTLVCIKELIEKGFTLDGDPVDTITWKVRWLRPADGQVMGEKSLTGRLYTSDGDVYGEPPREEYHDWLLNLFIRDEYPFFIQKEEAGVSNLAFSSDGKYLALVGDNYSTKIWDVTDHKTIFDQAGLIGFNCLNCDFQISFSPDKEYLVIESDNTLNVLKVGTWNKVYELKSEYDVLGCHSFSSDGSLLALDFNAGNDIGVKKYESSSGKEIETYIMDTPVAHLIISPQDKYLIAAIWHCDDTCNYMDVRIWNFTSHTIVSDISSVGIVQDMAMFPDGKTLAVLSYADQEISIFDIETGEQIDSLPGSDYKFMRMALSADGKLLAAGDWLGNLVTWDLGTRQIREISEGHDRISALAFSPDGSVLAVGGISGIVELWNIQK